MRSASEGHREGEWMLVHVHAGAEPGFVGPAAWTILGGGPHEEKDYRYKVYRALEGAVPVQETYAKLHCSTVSEPHAC